jgi:hypothetical protein
MATNPKSTGKYARVTSVPRVLPVNSIWKKKDNAEMMVAATKRAAACSVFLKA